MKVLILSLAFLVMTGVAPAMTKIVFPVVADNGMQHPKPPPAPKKAQKPPKPKEPKKPSAPKPAKKPKTPPKPPWVK